MEHRLSRSNERLGDITLVELFTLFVDSELQDRQHRLYETASILEPNGQAIGMCIAGEKVEIVHSVCFLEANAVGVGVAVHIVWVDSITAFACRHLDTFGHDGSHICRIGVEPPFALPSLQSTAFIRRLE